MKQVEESGNTAALCSQLGAVCGSEADCHRQLNQPDQARACFKESVQHLQACKSQDPEVRKSSDHMCNVFSDNVLCYCVLVWRVAFQRTVSMLRCKLFNMPHHALLFRSLTALAISMAMSNNSTQSVHDHNVAGCAARGHSKIPNGQQQQEVLGDDCTHQCIWSQNCKGVAEVCEGK